MVPTRRPGQVFGSRRLLCPVEEMIWSKAFIMERERYDAADIMHLLLPAPRTLDWARLLRRFGPHWRVLFSHLCCSASSTRQSATDSRMGHDRTHGPTRPARCGHRRRSEQTCQGTLLSREQYLTGCPALGPHRCAAHQRQLNDPDDMVLWTKAIDDESLSCWPAAQSAAGRMANRNAVLPMTTLSPSFNG